MGKKIGVFIRHRLLNYEIHLPLQILRVGKFLVKFPIYYLHNQ